jgi:predicted peroxiredoxin
MSYNKDNWKDKLDEVRNFGREPAVVVEEVLDNDTVINNEIEEELKKFFQEDETTETIEEEILLEASAGAMIDQLFNLKGDKDSQYGVAKMLSMTGVKVVQQMQKQNPKGFEKLVSQLGKEKKITLPTNSKLMKMFKDAGIKETVQEENLSVEKTVEKLLERNMLGRLAKSLRLDEEGKEKMFDYFENGELKQ